MKTSCNCLSYCRTAVLRKKVADELVGSPICHAIRHAMRIPKLTNQEIMNLNAPMELAIKGVCIKVSKIITSTVCFSSDFFKGLPMLKLNVSPKPNRFCE